MLVARWLKVPAGRGSRRPKRFSMTATAPLRLGSIADRSRPIVRLGMLLDNMLTIVSFWHPCKAFAFGCLWPFSMLFSGKHGLKSVHKCHFVIEKWFPGGIVFHILVASNSGEMGKVAWPEL